MKPGKRFRTFALATAVLTGAAVACVSAVTFASFSDTAPASATEVGAASVVLGREDTAPEFSFVDLRPGVESQPVALTVTYEGTVPADVALRLAPGPASPLCTERAGRKASGLAGGVLLAVGKARPRGYCELLGGAPLPLVAGMQPNTTVTVDVTTQLRANSAPSFSTLVQNDLATVTATGVGGGFSDEVTGRFDVATADFAGDPAVAADAASAARTAADPLASATETAPGVLATETAAGPVTITDPAAAKIELPDECARSGMRPDQFFAQIRLEPGATGADPAVLFGDSVGPFVIIGTDGGDTIVGSGLGDCVVGGDGDDVLRGGPGDDRLFGGLGAEQLSGDEGDDLLDGGADGATACDGTGDVRVAVGCPAVEVVVPAPPTEDLRTDGPPPAPVGGAVVPSDEPTRTTPPPPAAVPPPSGEPEPQTGTDDGSGTDDETRTTGAAESSSSVVPSTAAVSEQTDPAVS